MVRVGVRGLTCRVVMTMRMAMRIRPTRSPSRSPGCMSSAIRPAAVQRSMVQICLTK